VAEYVSNTSPLTHLHRADALDVLPAVCGVILIPDEVRSELRAGIARGKEGPDPDVIAWLHVVVAEQPADIAALRLGAGERGVLAVGRERDAIVILDDGPARGAAKRRGLRVTGTVGVLVQARHQGVLPAVRPVLDRLEAGRFRMSRELRDWALAQCGES
jgi:predicted nucleic acid-binding protein